MKHFKIFLVGLLLIAFMSCEEEDNSKKTDPVAIPNTEKETPKAPKYIFFFIGDGFGPAQAHLAEAYNANMNGTTAPIPLFMNTFPVQGTYTTFPDQKLITDSAAAGTALSSGFKTTNGTIGLDHNHEVAYQTLAEMLFEKGMKVGVVSCVSIDHATPASFYAHQKSRKMYYEIGLDLVKSGFNYFAGGGFVDPTGKRSKEPGKSVFEAAKEAGYKVVNTKADFKATHNGQDKVIVLDPKPMGAALPYVVDMTEENFNLMDYTKKGIELLDNEKGFFMMIEGGKIDWACHANDARTAVEEVFQLDNSVKVAFDFYQKHPEETLIIICSDHECGGLGLGYAMNGKHTAYDLLSKQTFSSDKISSIIDSKMDEILDAGNTITYKDIYPIITKYYGLDTEIYRQDSLDLDKAIKDYEIYLTKGYKEYNKNDKADYAYRYECDYGYYNPIATVASRILTHKSGASWTTYNHTAVPCPARAIGLGSEKFYGYYDNTDIPQKIMKMFGLTPFAKKEIAQE